MRLLTSAREMREAIRSVLAVGRRQRAIAVAFVGADALRFIPDPRGVTIYCWPKAGGTNPHAIERLRDAGATVHFVERLHMKLYFSADGGTVIGSANLTQNALGERGLLECGVRFTPSTANLAALFRKLPVTPNFPARLRRLHEEHVAFYQRNPVASEKRKSRPKAKTRANLSFAEWHRGGASRQPFRLGWYFEELDAPKDAASQLREQSGRVTYWRFLGVTRQSDLGMNKFTLNLRISASRSGKMRIGKPSWWIPEVCFKSAARGWREYPYIWFAQNRPSPSLAPPFDERDPVFIKALQRTISELGSPEMIDSEPAVPRSSLLRRLAANYELAAQKKPAKRTRG